MIMFFYHLLHPKNSVILDQHPNPTLYEFFIINCEADRAKIIVKTALYVTNVLFSVAIAT